MLTDTYSQNAAGGAGIYTGASYSRKTGTFVDAILHGNQWSSGYITYSFPDSLARYQIGYGNEIDDMFDFNRTGIPLSREFFYAATQEQRNVVQWALESGGAYSVEGFTNLDFAFAESSGEATIRFANSADQITSARVADFPGSSGFPNLPMYAGDIWLGVNTWGTPATGSYQYATILHELGHALGLKHPHQHGVPGFTDTLLSVASKAYNTVETTIMSYNSNSDGQNNGYSYGARLPQTYMPFDIYALQSMYGADYSANSGHTRYQWDTEGNSFIDGIFTLAAHPAYKHVFQTVWDGGGIDTYDLRNFSGGMSVDLRPGQASNFSFANLALIGGTENGGYAKGNVYNAYQQGGDPRSLIEQAFGGAGNDFLIGNQVRNVLWGGAGDDRIWGIEGNDILYGAQGNDSLYGGIDNDWLDGGLGADLLVGGPGADVFDFNSLADSALATTDYIDGFSGVGVDGGDVIDVRDIAASLGYQYLRAGSTGQGGLQTVDVAGLTEVWIFADAVAGHDFALRIDDGVALASSYIVNDFYGIG